MSKNGSSKCNCYLDAKKKIQPQKRLHQVQKVLERAVANLIVSRISYFFGAKWGGDDHRENEKAVTVFFSDLDLFTFFVCFM